MPYEILMPKLGLTMKTGTIVDWLRREGDLVAEKEPILEIETEKLSYNVESPAAGVIIKTLAIAGEKYPVKTVLGYIGEPGENIPDAANVTHNAPSHISNNSEFRIPNSEFPPADSEFRIPNSESPSPYSEFRIPNSEFRLPISPLAKKMAAEMGIDYRQIKGTGPNGRIVKADILNYTAPPKQEAFRPDTYAYQPDSSRPPETGVIIPYKGLRRSVGETMKHAWTTIPMVTHHVSADADALMKYRAMLNADVADKADRVTVGELLLKLTAVALAMTPIVNSTLSDEGIVLLSDIHLGMATAIDGGLIVPVIHDAGYKGLLAISREAKDLAFRARNGTLLPDDISGATFTVSNLGGFDSVDYFTPIINPPQAAILGVGRASDAVVPDNGEIKIKTMIGLSFTYDHRIIDGATAAVFIKTLMMLMDNPARSVLM